MEHSTFFDHGLEQALLGAILNNPALFAQAGVLVPADFHEPAHAEVYKAMVTLAEQNQPLTVALVKTELARVDRLQTTESVCRLAALARVKLSQEQFVAYLERVLSFAQARAVCLAMRSGNDARGITPKDYVERCRTVFNRAATSRSASGVVSMADAMLEFDALLEQVLNGESNCVGTSLTDLDWRLAGGFRPGQLWVLAARPGMGKTALAVQIAVAAAFRGQPVAFFSLEMLRVELVQRACCDWASVDWEQVKLKRHDERDLYALAEAQQALSQIPLAIFDQSSQRAEDVRATCFRLPTKPVLVVVDYLQLLRDNHTNRSDGIGATAAKLKALAKDLGCPVLALSQFNRQSEMRTSKKPQLSDLRGSGEIEQHADGVLILHRPEMYKPNDPALRGEAEIAIAKNRSGTTGIVKLGFEAKYTRFRDLQPTNNVVPLRKPNDSHDDYLETPHWQEEA